MKCQRAETNPFGRPAIPAKMKFPATLFEPNHLFITDYVNCLPAVFVAHSQTRCRSFISYTDLQYILTIIATSERHCMTSSAHNQPVPRIANAHDIDAGTAI